METAGKMRKPFPFSFTITFFPIASLSVSSFPSQFTHLDSSLPKTAPVRHDAIEHKCALHAGPLYFEWHISKSGGDPGEFVLHFSKRLHYEIFQNLIVMAFMPKDQRVTSLVKMTKLS